MFVHLTEPEAVKCIICKSYDGDLKLSHKKIFLSPHYLPRMPDCGHAIIPKVADRVIIKWGSNLLGLVHHAGPGHAFENSY